jgi:hypothetical protein
MTAVSQTCKNVGVLNDTVIANTVLTNRLALDNLNFITTSGAIAISANTFGAYNTATINYTADGLFFSKTTTANLWTLTGSAITGTYPAYTKYLLLLNASGTASVLQSSVSYVGLGSCIYPSMPDGNCVCGFVTITVNSGTFTPGSTALSAGNLTVTYNNGTDKYLFPLIADVNNGNQILQMSGLANSGSLLL